MYRLCSLHRQVAYSVADPGCLSRIRDPDFYSSRIPDPKTARKRWVKIIFLSYFFCSHKFHIIENYFIFEMLKKKIWANFHRTTRKIVTKLSKIWIWDPGSGKNLFRIPDPGVKKAPDPGSRIRIRNTAAKYKSRVQIRAGKAAVCVVTWQEGGHLATDHPHSHLQNIRVAYR